ncbi:MAG: hypothetical protein JNJ63_10410 [Hyphomonadaceae bacterium]|nr:hypothetical protein [Hyphomonadaceae bacterium]
MFRALIVLIIIGVAAYFTRPDEAKMRAAADAILQNPQTISEGIGSVVASLAAERHYDNYYVAAGYSVTVGEEKMIQCWGAFTQVKCDRVSTESQSGTTSN